LEHSLAFLLAARGFFDSLVWFFSHGFIDNNVQSTTLSFSQFRSSAPSYSSTSFNAAMVVTNEGDTQRKVDNNKNKLSMNDVVAPWILLRSIRKACQAVSMVCGCCGRDTSPLQNKVGEQQDERSSTSQGPLSLSSGGRQRRLDADTAHTSTSRGRVDVENALHQLLLEEEDDADAVCQHQSSHSRRQISFKIDGESSPYGSDADDDEDEDIEDRGNEEDGVGGIDGGGLHDESASLNDQHGVQGGVDGDLEVAHESDSLLLSHGSSRSGAQHRRDGHKTHRQHRRRTTPSHKPRQSTRTVKSQRPSSQVPSQPRVKPQSEHDVSPQLNLALREEVLQLVTQGIRESVQRNLQRERSRGVHKVPRRDSESDSDHSHRTMSHNSTNNTALFNSFKSSSRISLESIDFSQKGSFSQSGSKKHQSAPDEDDNNNKTNNIRPSFWSYSYHLNPNTDNDKQHHSRSQTAFLSALHNVLSAVGAYIPGEYGVDPIDQRLEDSLHTAWSQHTHQQQQQPQQQSMSFRASQSIQRPSVYDDRGLPVIHQRLYQPTATRAGGSAAFAAGITDHNVSACILCCSWLVVLVYYYCENGFRNISVPTLQLFIPTITPFLQLPLVHPNN
jgi:hypothetical protein